jgi:hypothetical protein
MLPPGRTRYFFSVVEKRAPNQVDIEKMEKKVAEMRAIEKVSSLNYPSHILHSSFLL